MSAVGDARKRQQERAQAGAVDGLSVAMEQVAATIATTYEPEFALTTLIGLLPDCDHPTSRGVCPNCIASAIVAAGYRSEGL